MGVVRKVITQMSDAGIPLMKYTTGAIHSTPMRIKIKFPRDEFPRMPNLPELSDETIQTNLEKIRNAMKRCKVCYP